MTTIVQNTFAATTVPIFAVLGSKTGRFIATTEALPSWVAPILGPAGALIGMVLAIRWLLTRLDKAEVKAEARDHERDNNLRLITTMVVQNQAVIEQNSEVIGEVRAVIKKCQGHG